MLTHKVIFVALAFIFTKWCECRKYHNYTLYRGMPVNEDHLHFFSNISSQFDISFWRPPTKTYRPIEFIISPDEKDLFLLHAQRYGVYLTTVIQDLQSVFDQQTVKAYIRRNMDSFDWRSYYRLNCIYTWLKDVSRMYPDEVKTFSLGRTYENRNIMGVKVVLKGSEKRSAVIVEGGVHAREWIAPAFVTYMIKEILHAPFSDNKELKQIALTYIFYFIPVLNPDGYEYSHTEDRLWRKNRDQQYGADINRNFDIAFGTTGVSFKRTSEIYCGVKAFSEPESRGLAHLVKTVSPKLEYYLAFHSYGQYMILPYANRKEHLDNFDEVKAMCVQAANNISKRFGTRYTIGTAYDTVGYMTSGVSGCWVKRKYRVPYVVVFELRDSGKNGFALPPSLILPTSMETMDGIISLLKPSTRSFSKLKLEVPLVDGQENVMQDRFFIILFVSLIINLIIVRFV